MRKVVSCSFKGWGENEESQEQLQQKLLALQMGASSWNSWSNPSHGFLSWFFYVSLRIAGGDGCPAPIDFLKKLLMRSVFLMAFSRSCKQQQSWEESNQIDGERLIAEYEYALRWEPEEAL